MEMTLKDKEAGYARVADAKGFTKGYIVRDKVGSTRTGTAWLVLTPGRRNLGQCDTQVEAVALLAKWHDERSNR